MHSLILMLLLRPDIKERARHELEEVIGTGKLPTFDDIGTVPYIDALIMELFRQYPIVPLGPYANLTYQNSCTYPCYRSPPQTAH